MNKLQEFLRTFFPSRCIICDTPIFEEGFCKKCTGLLKPIGIELCPSCGMEAKGCVCDERIMHFDGIIAPYLNEGYAQTAIYNLKFRKMFNCVEVFGEQMATFAEKYFGAENIDIICYVPLNRSSRIKRGFDQCEVLAVRVAEVLNKPLVKDLLFKNEDVKTQHSLAPAERFENVKDAYYTKGRIKNKNVLLVDDIKTTGASLDACARKLKFAGANKVYCVTALITPKQTKKTDKS